MRVWTPPDQAVALLLERHPRVDLVGEARFLTFGDGRELRVDDPYVETKGLVELMDNNPLVCADVASVPGPLSTLALVALGPLCLMGLAAELEVSLSHELKHEHLDEFMESVGWHGAVRVASDEGAQAGVLGVSASATLNGDVEERDVAELYEERYGRSFFVRTGDGNSVAGTPYAEYETALSGGRVRIEVRADRDGKCGAAQLVHAMNVMCGFEETLGVL